MPMDAYRKGDSFAGQFPGFRINPPHRTRPVSHTPSSSRRMNQVAGPEACERRKRYDAGSFLALPPGTF